MTSIRNHSYKKRPGGQNVQGHNAQGLGLGSIATGIPVRSWRFSFLSCVFCVCCILA